MGVAFGATGYLYAGIPVVILAIVIASALKMANTWEKFVILRAGKLRGVKGPGLFCGAKSAAKPPTGEFR